MPLNICSLRRWFAIGAPPRGAGVGGVLLFYARCRVTKALKEVPGKIGLEIQQSAQGLLSRSQSKDITLFKIQTGKAIQYWQGGRAELLDVTITLYGGDSSRYDQI